MINLFISTLPSSQGGTAVWKLFCLDSGGVCLSSLCIFVGLQVCFSQSPIYHQLCIFAYQVSYRYRDTWTLQTDKCFLTLLRQISTWSLGSLPSTHFYLHLLCLTLNLPHDLWFQCRNPSPHSVLFFLLHLCFCFFLYIYSVSLLICLA